MELKKLNQADHGQTRALWEDVFKEDTKNFLDYYYEYKVIDNQIYVMEEDGVIISMLQLNPYHAYVENQIERVNYIVAVATQEAYRGRGNMGALLRFAVKEMYRKREPFAFLMPAVEAIYTPYDFVTVTAQQSYQYTGELSENRLPKVVGYDVVVAQDRDCEALAKLTDQIQKHQYQVSICRDSAFFQRLIKEQTSQNGCIVLLMKEEILEGYFFMAGEKNIQIRDPVMRDQSVDWYDLLQLSILEEPPMMIRIVHLQGLLECLKPKGDFATKLEVLDPIITENTGVYQLRSEAGVMYCKRSSDEVNEDTALTISELTGYLFGKSADSNLSKLNALSKICLHEIV